MDFIKKKKFFSEQYFIRSIDFFDIFETFFISAVVAILGIRIYLQLTNYPTIGGNGLHIAHMLWGGILMLISILLLLTLLNKDIKKIAAILGGLGFGAFVDEIGKFITSDNNYFFQPTFAIIYFIFIIIYFVVYVFEKHKEFSPKEYLVNSIEYLKQAVIKDLSIDEKKEALQYLVYAEGSNQITKFLEKLYHELDTVSNKKPNFFAKTEAIFKNIYFNLIEKVWFERAVIIFFILQFIVSSFILLVSTYIFYSIVISGDITLKELSNNSVQFFDLLANAIAGIFVFLGVLKIRKSRIEAYKMFKKAMLVSILLVQFFSFYQNQLSAFTGLMFDVFILMTLNYMIDQERLINLEEEITVTDLDKQSPDSK